MVNKGTTKILEEQLQNEQQVKNNLQNQINNHICSINCSHHDYETIKKERDTYQQQIVIKLKQVNKNIKVSKALRAVQEKREIIWINLTTLLATKPGKSE